MLEKKYGIKLIYNPYDYTCVILIENQFLRVYLGISNGIGPSLGFPDSCYISFSKNKSSYPVNIIKPLQVSLHCDLVESSHANYRNGRHILSNISISCPLETLFDYEPPTPIYTQMVEKRTEINLIGLTIRDKDFKKINFQKFIILYKLNRRNNFFSKIELLTMTEIDN